MYGDAAVVAFKVFAVDDLGFGDQDLSPIPLLAKVTVPFRGCQ